MISPLFQQIGHDLNISRYTTENDVDYEKRLVFSALGCWALSLVKNNPHTSKTLITRTLNSLTKNFIQEDLRLSSFFIADDDPNQNIDVKIIRLSYEAMGYFLLNDDNTLSIANYGRGLKVSDSFMIFGMPNCFRFMTGLGVFDDKCYYEECAENILVRDSLTFQEYINSEYDEASFYALNDSDGIEFFNPTHKGKISESWTDHPATKFTIAKTLDRQYYKIISLGEKILRCEQIDGPSESLFGYDYYRTIHSLRAYYEHPSYAEISILDSRYALLKIFNRIPNREYYFILMMSWPVFKINRLGGFIVPLQNLPILKKTLERIGIKIIKFGAKNG